MTTLTIPPHRCSLGEIRKQRLESNVICITGNTRRGRLALCRNLEKTFLRRHLSLLNLSEWAGSPWWRRHRTRQRQSGQDALTQRHREHGLGNDSLSLRSLTSQSHKPFFRGKSTLYLILGLCPVPHSYRAAERCRTDTDQWAQGNDAWVTLSPMDNPFTWLGRPADAPLPFYPIVGSPGS